MPSKENMLRAHPRSVRHFSLPPSLRTKQVEQQANVSEPLRRYGYLRGLSQEETAK